MTSVTYTYVCAVYKPHFQKVILPLAIICVFHENVSSLDNVSCIVFLLASSKSKRKRLQHDHFTLIPTPLLPVPQALGSKWFPDVLQGQFIYVTILATEVLISP